MSEKQIDKAELLKSLGIENDIETWKKQYGKIQLLQILGQAFVFRGVRRIEWKQITDAANKQAAGDTIQAASIAQELTVSRAVLYPKECSSNLPGLPAGTVSRLADEIMRLSGFGRDDEEVIEL